MPALGALVVFCITARNHRGGLHHTCRRSFCKSFKQVPATLPTTHCGKPLHSWWRCDCGCRRRTASSVSASKSDNVGALRTLLKMTSPSQPMGLVAREIALDVAAGNYQMTELRHVAGISNVVADALSRMWSPEPLEFPLQRRRVEGPGPRLRIQILEGRVKKNRSALKQPRFTGRSSLRVDFTSEDGEAQEGGGQKLHR